MKFKWVIIIVGFLVIACEKKVEKEDIAKNVTKSEEAVIDEALQEKIDKKLSKEEQIASAILAAPMEARENAKVYGYDEEGELVVLRDGDNAFICIADNPHKKGFEVVSYHRSLEPYMSSGRELVKSGKSRQEKDSIREAKALAGIVKMPEAPATLHIYYGKDGYYDVEAGKIENAKYRYVVYIPYATQESTGLSLKPNKSNHPWLMFPGKYNAHIMITPAE